MRGLGWGRKHNVVDYVFRYEIGRLHQYHLEVMKECVHRNFEIDPKWYLRTYRGKKIGTVSLSDVGIYVWDSSKDSTIYPEHDDRYLLECLLNLKAKGAQLVNGATIEEFLLELESKGVQC